MNPHGRESKSQFIRKILPKWAQPRPSRLGRRIIIAQVNQHFPEWKIWSFKISAGNNSKLLLLHSLWIGRRSMQYKERRTRVCGSWKIFFLSLFSFFIVKRFRFVRLSCIALSFHSLPIRLFFISIVSTHSAIQFFFFGASFFHCSAFHYLKVIAHQRYWKIHSAVS